MDPCQFVRIRVGNLALKLPNQPTSTSSSTTSLTNLRHHHTTTTTTTSSTSSPSTSSSSTPFYYCKIKFANFTPQTTSLPLASHDAASGAGVSSTAAACFSLSKPDLDKLITAEKKKKNKKKSTKQQQQSTTTGLGLTLKIEVYSGKSSATTTGCFFGGSSGRKFIGRVNVSLSDLDKQERTGSVHNGWVNLDGNKTTSSSSETQLYVSVKSEPDPRFVFEFESEPECSPQVFQVQGCIRQPVFTCKFGFKNSSEWGNNGGRSSSSSGSESSSNERKGWTVTIHDLSGSPIAAASMVTPFVPSPGTDRVSKSNPGAWLILRPGDGTWKPWGRLEAWRERSATTGGYSLGHRFEIIPDPSMINGVGCGSGLSPAGITLSNGLEISTEKGGKFTIDIGSYNSPVTSPSSSFDLGSWNGSGGSGSSESAAGGAMWWWPQFMYRGFVMSATVGGEKEKKGKGPEVVEVGVQHVNCAEDAAVFVALAAAMNLSMDACMPFSKKLNKDLRHQRSGDLTI